MRSYRQLFRTAEFTPLFVASCAQVAASTLTSLSLGTLVYARTESPLLSALAMFGPSIAQLIGANTLLSIADRVRPRAALTTTATIGGMGGLILALPGMPLAAMFVIVFALSLPASISGGSRFALVTEILSPQGYLLGRSMLNIAVGVMQIVGFAAGGVLVVLISPRGALVTGAALMCTAAIILRIGLQARPARASGRASVVTTWRVNRDLLADPSRRAVYLTMWVPNGLVVGCEALFVPYARDRAAVLFVAAAAGMLAGDVAAGRFLPPASRTRFIRPLRYLLAAPYLLFVIPLPLSIAAVAVAVASVGYAASLLLQERLIALTADEVRGQALGLASAGMMAMQAVGAAAAGLIAEFLTAGTAITVMAIASLIVTAALGPGLRLSGHAVERSGQPSEPPLAG